MSAQPINAIAAVLVSAMVYPGLRLLDRLNGNCGDGLCGVWSGALGLGGLAIATLILVVRSARRQEQPASLRLAPPLVWMVTLATLLV